MTEAQKQHQELMAAELARSPWKRAKAGLPISIPVGHGITK